MEGHTSVQGQLLEINVVGCRNLKDTEWFSRQDPYVVIEYANTKLRTRTDTDGGKNPSFNEKFTLTLIEGLREVNVNVWNSNSVSFDDFIGSGKIQLQKVLSSGYDDNSWPLATRSGKHAGEIRVIMHYSNAKSQHGKTGPKHEGAPVPPYGGAPVPPYGGAPNPYGGAPNPYGEARNPYPGQPAASPYMVPAGYPPQHSAQPSYPAYPPFPGPSAQDPSLSGYPPPSGYPPLHTPPYPSVVSHGAYPAPGYPPPGGHVVPFPGVYPSHPGGSGKAHSGYHGEYKQGKHKDKHKHKHKHKKGYWKGWGKFKK